MFPGFDHLFQLTSPLATRPFVADLDGDLPIDPATGIITPSFLLRGEASSSSLVATHAAGEKVPGDIVWTSWAYPILVGPRVVEAFAAAQLSGWRSVPVRLMDGFGREHAYHFLVVTGRCASIDYSRSSREWKIYPGGKFPLYRGVYFEQESWDGSDFFMESRHTARVFVTTGVVQVFRANKIRNVHFTRLSELEVDEDFVSDLKRDS